MGTKTLSIAALLFVVHSPAFGRTAADEDTWPQWRGPLGTGVAPAADPPVRWSEDENVAWKVPLPGHGKSTPIVDGRAVYLLAAEEGRTATAEELAARAPLADQSTEPGDRLLRFLVLAIDRETGERLWEREVGQALPIAGVHQTNGYASGSPVTDGERLFASFGSYGVYALDLAGEVLWSFDPGPLRTRRGWGEGASPGLSGDTVIVCADQEDDSFVVALDAATGEVRWRRERDEPSTWNTPCFVERDAGTQVILNGTTAVRSYDLASGEVLWQCDGQTLNAIPTPVSNGDVVVCASGFRGSAAYAFALDARGDLRESEGAILWHHDKGTPYVPSPLLLGDRVFFTGSNAPRLSILDLATGEVLLDRERLPDLADVYASPVAAAGRIYLVGRDGTTLVFRYGDELEFLATNGLEDPIDASPAAVGKSLFLRSDAHLYCIRED